MAERRKFNLDSLTDMHSNLLNSAARYAHPKCILEGWHTLCFLNLVWIKISHDEIKAASKIFRHMDDDHNGVIEKKEFMHYLKNIDGYKEMNDGLIDLGATKENYNRVWD